MNKDILFAILNQKSQEELLELLNEAWRVMSTNQRSEIFSPVMSKEQYEYPASGKKTLAAIRKFHKESYDGEYYAPFDINSKNYMNIPEETDGWFARLDELFTECTKLSNQKEYSAALEGYELLFELAEAVDSGEEIIFADETGMWMFTGDEKAYFTAYIKAAAGGCSDEEFVEKAMYALRQDNDRCCGYELYSVVQSIATKEQAERIDGEIKSRNLKVSK
ncbi:hypothetical protein NX722_00595 [Endozoicomonas gorgoniicola]|uniref:Uncharacterized protein n=1 Tax=Endozoicomonas gorgoniicola TaxID=1234144 RepID=A0ABT3MP86_9GAMM|nr:hypothetical protein [Endozoicomonas gorgoniicola]MCW7551180.1 hypothetical protein [Endozoicomonas gorgoniicola]